MASFPWVYPSLWPCVPVPVTTTVSSTNTPHPYPLASGRFAAGSWLRPPATALCPPARGCSKMGWQEAERGLPRPTVYCSTQERRPSTLLGLLGRLPNPPRFPEPLWPPKSPRCLIGRGAPLSWGRGCHSSGGEPLAKRTAGLRNVL